MEQGSLAWSGSGICLSVHGGAEPAVPPLAVCPAAPPVAEGPPAEAGAPPAPAITVDCPPDAETPVPALPTLARPALVTNAPLAPPAASPMLLSQELSGKTKSMPVKARLKAWRGLRTNI